MWCWRRLLRVSWTARRSNQSFLKEINPEYSLEGLMVKLKLQYFGHLIANSWLTGKDPDSGKDWGQEEKRTTKDEMVGWHHRLNGHEFEQALGVADGQGNLACCSPWSCKELGTTERLNWTELILLLYLYLFHVKHMATMTLHHRDHCSSLNRYIDRQTFLKRIESLRVEGKKKRWLWLDYHICKSSFRVNLLIFTQACRTIMESMSK